MAFLSGWGGRVLIAGTTALPVTRWLVNCSVDLAETTAGTGTVKTYVPGYMDLEATIDLLWDTGLSIVGTANLLRLRPGDSLKVQLYLDASTSARAWTFPSFIVSSAEMEDSVRDVVKWTVMGKQSGEAGVLFPTNLVPDAYSTFSYLNQ